MRLLPGEALFMIRPGFGIMMRLGLCLPCLSGDKRGMGLSINYCLFVIRKMRVKHTDTYGHDEIG
jgi:hypothetical protein